MNMVRWVLRRRAVQVCLVLVLASAVVLVPLLTPAAQPPAPVIHADQVKLSAQHLLYRSDERPQFQLTLPAARANNALGMMGIARAYAASDQIMTSVTYKGHKVDVPVVVKHLGGGEYSLSLSPNSHTKPGRYTVEARIQTSGGVITKSQNFAWGVLAVNTTKPTYEPGEVATIQMAVLSSTGNTLCAAPLALTVTAPDGSISKPDVQKPEDCHADQYSDAPDYGATYQTTVAGKYQMKLQLADSDYILTDSFMVAAGDPFSIERSGPTRLFPPSPYTMKVTITAHRDFKGVITEKLPAGFTITDAGGAGQTRAKDGPALAWPADMRAGETRTLQYAFKAPMVSPAFYFFPPLTLTEGGRTAYQESRQWQMAGDAVITYVNETSGNANGVSGNRSITATSTSGDTLILLFNPRVNNSTTPQTFTVTDSASNTWVVPAGGATSTNPPYMWQGTAFNGFVMAYALNAAAVTSVTIGGLSSNYNVDYDLVEFSNISSTSAVDQSNAAARTSSATQSTPTLTTTNANDLIIGGMAAGASNTYAISSSSSPTGGWTKLYVNPPQPATSNFLGIYYQVVSSTGSYQVTETLGTAATAGTGIMAFTTSTVVGCTPTTDDLMRGGNYFCNGAEAAGFFWAS
jgi:hypothetical protein